MRFFFHACIRLDLLQSLPWFGSLCCAGGCKWAPPLTLGSTAVSSAGRSELLSVFVGLVQRCIVPRYCCTSCSLQLIQLTCQTGNTPLKLATNHAKLLRVYRYLDPRSFHKRTCTTTVADFIRQTSRPWLLETSSFSFDWDRRIVQPFSDPVRSLWRVGQNHRY